MSAITTLKKGFISSSVPRPGRGEGTTVNIPELGKRGKFGTKGEDEPFS